MCNVKVKDRVPSKKLRERLGIDDIILLLQQNRLQWYGHVLRKEDTDWVKKCMERWRAPDQEVDQRGHGGQRAVKRLLLLLYTVVSPYGSIVGIYSLPCLCFFVCMVTDFSAAKNDSGVKLCMLVRLQCGQVFSHFGELWPRGGFPPRKPTGTSGMIEIAPGRKTSPACMLDGQLE